MHDEPFGPLWTAPHTDPKRRPDEISRPVELDDVDVDPDLRVRLRAWSDAVSASVWEVGSYKTHIHPDDDLLDVECDRLTAELVVRDQPAGWRVVGRRSAESSRADRSMLGPASDAVDRYALPGASDRGARQLVGGNAAVRRWETTLDFEGVVDRIPIVDQAGPGYRCERYALWSTETRLEVPCDELFVTDWVVAYADDPVAIEMGRVVLPAPRTIPSADAPPAQPDGHPGSVLRRWVARRPRRVGRGR